MIKYILKYYAVIGSCMTLFLLVVAFFNVNVEAEEGTKTELQISVVSNKEIIWTQEMEDKRIKASEAKKIVKPVKVTPKVSKPVVAPKEVKIDKSFDIDKLAKAVAIAETGDCKKGYGKSYNNCFGIKNGNTAPCPKIGRNRMCIYEKPEDSYEAFKKIWGTHYKIMPNLRLAKRWTGEDHAVRWLANVNRFYFQ